VSTLNGARFKFSTANKSSLTSSLPHFGQTAEKNLSFGGRFLFMPAIALLLDEASWFVNFRRCLLPRRSETNYFRTSQTQLTNTINALEKRRVPSPSALALKSFAISKAAWQSRERLECGAFTTALERVARQRILETVGRTKSGAEATALHTLARWPDGPQLREAFGECGGFSTALACAKDLVGSLACRPHESGGERTALSKRT